MNGLIFIILKLQLATLFSTTKIAMNLINDHFYIRNPKIHILYNKNYHRKKFIKIHYLLTQLIIFESLRLFSHIFHHFFYLMIKFVLFSITVASSGIFLKRIFSSENIKIQYDNYLLHKFQIDWLECDLELGLKLPFGLVHCVPSNIKLWS